MADQGGGVVLTIHDLTLAARIADRVIIIDDGRVVADGTPQDALTPQILRDVYNIHAQWLHGGDGTPPTIAIHGRATRG
jgi:iron complex transport system ATP-binding protein